LLFASELRRRPRPDALFYIHRSIPSGFGQSVVADRVMRFTPR
jgi:hypothetical protein